MNSKLELPKTYSPAQAAEALGVTRRTLYSYIEKGLLPASKTQAGKWLITQDNLLTFMGLDSTQYHN